jgi:hypothetical protein
VDTLLELCERYDAIKARPKYPYSRRFLTTVYPRYLAPRRLDPVTVLEVGVWNGGAMEALRDYFPEGQIVGADLVDRVKQEISDWERMHFYQGDQGSAEFLQSVATLQGPFDFVIEDGSHQFEHQVNTFETLWPNMTSGGVYFVEDVIPCWEGEKILSYFKARITPERFSTQQPKDIESIAFHQGMIVITKG